MGDNSSYYENAPIILSMLQFRYDKIREFDINLIKKIAQEIKIDFPIVNERFVQNIVIKNDSSETSISLEDKKFDGIQVMSKNRKQYFTIAESKFTFQSHEKYKGWDNFIKNIVKFWKLFNESFKIEELNGISLRYVNKINLPKGTKEITTYFTTHLQDNHNTFSIRNFQFRFSSYDKQNNFNINISHLLDAPIENSIPYIFDIDVLLNTKLKNDTTFIWSLFDKIRKKKNQIFNDGITEETKKLIN